MWINVSPRETILVQRGTHSRCSFTIFKGSHLYLSWNQALIGALLSYLRCKILPSYLFFFFIRTCFMLGFLEMRKSFCHGKTRASRNCFTIFFEAILICHALILFCVLFRRKKNTMLKYFDLTFVFQSNKTHNSSTMNHTRILYALFRNLGD